MATISFNIPDAAMPRVIDAFATAYQYQATVPNPNGEGTVPNPQTKAQFARQRILSYIQEVVRAAEASAAVEAARASAAAADAVTIT